MIGRVLVVSVCALVSLVATPAFAKDEYLCDLLQKKPYRAAWDALLAAEKKVPAWVTGYGKDCDGPSTPAKTVTIDGRKYRLASFCKSHDCGDNNFHVIFAPGARQAWALLATDKQRWLGNPPPAIRAALEAAAK